MKWKIIFLTLFTHFFLSTSAFAETSDSDRLIDISIGNQGDLTSSLEIFLIVALLSFVPSFIIMFTCYPYVLIVLGITRMSLGTQGIPPNQVLTGIALIFTISIMNPVFSEVYEKAYVPYEEGTLEFKEAIGEAEKPLKEFMIANTYDGELAVFYQIREEKIPEEKEDVSIWSAVLGFQLTQLLKGLIIGMGISAAFVAIDTLVALILMYKGMMMLPPVMISLPLKLLIFVSLGGFTKIVELLYRSIVV